jgi:hypothetical protein
MQSMERAQLLNRVSGEGDLGAFSVVFEVEEDFVCLIFFLNSEFWLVERVERHVLFLLFQKHYLLLFLEQAVQW